jgi:uncharacterized protein YndB with AHSA1/START domain
MDTGRTIVVEDTIDGSLEDVWHGWITTEGITSFLTSAAEVELKIGGKYELYFSPDASEGSRGPEECRVLSYLPMEMLSFSWNAPPTIPTLRSRGPITWVVVQFAKIREKQVHLKITMMGIGEGEDWDRYYQYFSRAWPNVMTACKEFFAGR